MLFGAVTLTTEGAQARSFRMGQVPNQPDGCGTCHISVGGGGPRNVFGQQVEANLTEGDRGNVQWALIFDLDADGDGCSNGAELGDPGGTWRINDPEPAGPTSAPHLPNDNVCATMQDMGGASDMGPVDGPMDGGMGGDMMQPMDLGMPMDMGADPDQGMMPDPDMGMPNPDLGGAPDAGPAADAGPSADAGTQPDDNDDGGCESVPPSSASLWLLAALWIGLRTRRQRTASAYASESARLKRGDRRSFGDASRMWSRGMDCMERFR